MRALLARVQPNPFLDDLRVQTTTLAWFGALNSIAMTAIKFTSPGVPDLYQGSELIELSLVDPDNRRPVDYALRSRLLEEFERVSEGSAQYAKTLLADPADGRAKLWATWRLLEQRRKAPELFRDGSYVPLEAHGAQAGHVVAYARKQGIKTLVVISGRLFAKLLGEAGKLPLGKQAWADTTLDAAGLADGSQFENALTGETVTVEGGRIRLSHAFANLPGAALLAKIPGSAVSEM